MREYGEFFDHLRIKKQIIVADEVYIWINISFLWKIKIALIVCVDSSIIINFTICYSKSLRACYFKIVFSSSIVDIYSGVFDIFNFSIINWVWII